MYYGTVLRKRTIVPVLCLVYVPVPVLHCEENDACKLICTFRYVSSLCSYSLSTASSTQILRCTSSSLSALPHLSVTVKHATVAWTRRLGVIDASKTWPREHAKIYPLVGRGPAQKVTHTAPTSTLSLSLTLRALRCILLCH